MNNVRLNIYSDLNSSNQFNSHKIQDSFNFDLQNIEDINFLGSISVKEITLERHSKDKDYGFDEQFKNIGLKNILVPKKAVIALITEHQIKSISKLRSHKGILSKELKGKSKYLEEEIFINEQQTIIGTLVIVTSENIENILDNYFGDSNTCCFFHFESPVNFQKEFLNNILENCMVHTQLSVINYFSLCKLLRPDEQVIRIGGDGHDEVSVQIFSLK